MRIVFVSMFIYFVTAENFNAVAENKLKINGTCMSIVYVVHTSSPYDAKFWREKILAN